MAYTAWSVSAFEQPSAAKWNQLGANDAGFKDATNIDSAAIITRHLGVALSEGILENGEILVTVASNNITLALKTTAGTDPTVLDPVKVMIAGTLYTITAALSVTVNATINTFNAGSAELATQAIDYFAYLGVRSGAVFIAFSRVIERVYSSFSGTATNEKYLAFSGSTPNASDPVAIIGRFEATLSAGASYNWSVPSYTNDNLVQRPIFETRWRTWAPQYSASGSMTYTTVTTAVQEYKLVDRVMFINHRSTGTTGGSLSNEIIISLPFAWGMAAEIGAGCSVADGGSNLGGIALMTNATAQLRYRRYDSANYTSGASRIVYVTMAGKI